MRWTSSTKVTLAAGFIEPCLPTVVAWILSGESWVFEPKWDDYRLLVRKRMDDVRVYSPHTRSDPNGLDLRCLEGALSLHLYAFLGASGV